MKYENMTSSQQSSLYEQLLKEYEKIRSLNLDLNMTRGKPCNQQFAICDKMQQALDNYISEDGTDVRNYGTLEGIPEARRLFSLLLDMPEEQVIIGGSSSLNLMFDMVCRAYIHGVLPDQQPWSKQGMVKFLCPSPGYDRHFTITQSFGINMIPVPVNEDGPDMDTVEQLAAADPLIKGIWCVPMYNNPDGSTYSDQVVRRFASMATAAPDFRIFWDNAYCVHHLDLAHKDKLCNLYDECLKNGTEDRVYAFASTSKITLAGSGISAMAMSPANYSWTRQLMSVQTICCNGVNQLRHARFLPDMAAVEEVMGKHADIIRPKFRLVLDKLTQEIAPLGIANWHEPKGGSFISFFAINGCAKRIVELCKAAGLQLTAAGATYPYGIDPDDSNIRIAPTYPSLSELNQAMDLFCLAIKMASLEKLLGKLA